MPLTTSSPITPITTGSRIILPLAYCPLYQATPRDINVGIDLGKKLHCMGNIAKKVVTWSLNQRAEFLQKGKETVVTTQNRFLSVGVETRTQLMDLHWNGVGCHLLFDLGEIEAPIPWEHMWYTSTLRQYAHFYLPLCVHPLFFPSFKVFLTTLSQVQLF
jgi:hypothetical protein